MNTTSNTPSDLTPEEEALLAKMIKRGLIPTGVVVEESSEPNRSTSRKKLAKRKGAPHTRGPSQPIPPELIVTMQDCVDYHRDYCINKLGLTQAQIDAMPGTYGFGRVSVDDLGTSDSPRSQMQRQMKLMGDNGHRPSGFCDEHAVTGWKREGKRPKLDAARKLIRGHALPPGTDSVSCFSGERLTRRKALGEQFIEECRDGGVSIQCVDFRRWATGKDANEAIDMIEDHLSRSFSRGHEETKAKVNAIDRANDLKAERGIPLNYIAANVYGSGPMLDEIETANGSKEMTTVGSYRLPGEESTTVDETLKRLDRNERPYSIVCDLVARGITTRGGFDFTNKTLIDFVLSPTTYGFVVRKGEIYPRVGQYAPGEAPIEAAGTREQFLRNLGKFARSKEERDLAIANDIELAPRRRKVEPARYEYSNLCSCPSCPATDDSPRGSVVGSRTNGVGSDSHYRCQKKHLTYKPGPALPGNISRDGLTHACFQTPILDSLGDMIFFDYLDNQKTGEDAAARVVGSMNAAADAELVQIENEIAATSAKRRNVRDSHDEGEYDGDMDTYHAKMRDLSMATEGLLARKTNLLRNTHPERDERLAEPAKLREQWGTMTLAVRRELRSLVFADIVINPSPRQGMNIKHEDRLDFVFRSGVANDARIQQLKDAHFAARMAVTTHNIQKLDTATENRIVELFEIEKLTPAQIGPIVHQEGLRPVRTKDERGFLVTTRVVGVLERHYKRKGERYVAHKMRAANWVSNLIEAELARGDKTWPEITVKLVSMDAARPGPGKTMTANWSADGEDAREFYGRRQKVTGKGGRPTRLPQLVRELIYDLRVHKGLTFQAVADHLIEKGIPTGTGSLNWGTGQVGRIVNQERERRTKLGMTL